MPKYPHELVSPTSLVLLQPLLDALDATGTAMLKPAASLPMPCFEISDIRTLIAATPISAVPVFRPAMIAFAATAKVDVIVVRHGLWPETLDEVVIDVVMGRMGPTQMLWELGRYRGADGSSWLVPPAGGAGPSVQLDSAGLRRCAAPPYADLDERGDGLARAARETVLAMRRLRGPQ